MHNDFALADIPRFSESPLYLAAFRRGGFRHVLDLYIHSPADIAKKCSVQLSEAHEMVNIASRALYTEPRYLSDILPKSSTVFTTGDATLDRMLGGGIQTGMIWEIMGEGAAGKTQLALQLSLTVQLPESQGGLGGSACYLTTYSGLPTPRLVEIAENHRVLTGEEGLDHIDTLETRTIDILLLVLFTALPALVARRASTARPVKLLVIDALADLFREDVKTNTAQLVERSGFLSDVAQRLHTLANAHQLAVVVINHVVEVFDALPQAVAGELIYAEQARLFASGDSLLVESRKKAALGLVWANEINVRLMLTRTGRRRVLDDRPVSKRQRTVGPGSSGGSDSSSHREEDSAAQEALIRRLSVIFSTTSEPSSADFVLTAQGVELLPDEPPHASVPVTPAATRASGTNEPSASQLNEVALLDVAYAQNSSASPLQDDVAEQEPPVDGDEDEEAYWHGMDDVWDAVEGDESLTF